MLDRHTEKNGLIPPEMRWQLAILIISGWPTMLFFFREYWLARSNTGDGLNVDVLKFS